MSSSHSPSRLNLQAFAAEGKPLSGDTLLQNMERLSHESIGLEADSVIKWQARAEFRDRAGSDSDVWLHLAATTSIPLTCQRCMTAVDIPLEIDQWYRFVATEDIAMAEDDDAEEDLLVIEPQFDLLNLLEDELLMALPVVPMHDECPVAPKMQAGDLAAAAGAGDDGRDDGSGGMADKKNPFAVLAQLKNGPKSS